MIPAEILISFAGGAAVAGRMSSRLINYLLGPIYCYTFRLSFLVNEGAFDYDRSGVKGCTRAQRCTVTECVRVCLCLLSPYKKGSELIRQLKSSASVICVEV